MPTATPQPVLSTEEDKYLRTKRVKKQAADIAFKCNIKMRFTLFFNSIKNKGRRCIFDYPLWKSTIDKQPKIGSGLGTIPILRN